MDPGLFNFILPVQVEVLDYIKLDGEVSRRDRLDIPFDVVVLLRLLDVVVIVYDKERNEDGCTAQH